MSARPWFKFYRRQWSGNLQLRGCSKAARALWIDVLSMSDEDGHVRYSDAQIAAFFGESVDVVQPMLLELSAAGILKRDAEDWLLIKTMSTKAYEAKYGDAEQFDFESEDEAAEWEEEERIREDARNLKLLEWAKELLEGTEQ